MICVCEACEADIIKINNKINVDVELRDLVFKTFNLVIKFFIIFIICASIALLKISCEVIMISINLIKGSILL